MIEILFQKRDTLPTISLLNCQEDGDEGLRSAIRTSNGGKKKKPAEAGFEEPCLISRREFSS
jgi:hypothetical protein